MKRTVIEHEFVDFVPSELEDGTLYVSIPYATAVHKCTCGCGNKVVTPINPAWWQLTFDGDTVSLAPSIANWEFPCQTHYWIKSNKILWAGDWTPEQIDIGKQRDARDLERYFEGRSLGTKTPLQQGTHARQGLFVTLRQWLKR